MIESNIIYNFEDFRTIISSKSQIDSYYLIYNDFYFEQIDKYTNLTRDTFTITGRFAKSFNIIKYMSFKVKDNYSTKELYEFLELSKQHTKILLTIYNPKKKECFLLFISNKDNSKLEKEIINLLEMEK